MDFYSGLIYQAMGYPTDYFTVLFALGRLPGWLAQWEEMLLDKDQKIARPRQIYIGAEERDFVPLERGADEGVGDRPRAVQRKSRRFWTMRLGVPLTTWARQLQGARRRDTSCTPEP